MSDSIVFRINVRSVADVVRGRSGKSVLSSLEGCQAVGLASKEGGALNGRYHVFVTQHDEVLHQRLASVRRECAIVLQEEG
jgi:hypothetical protein